MISKMKDIKVLTNINLVFTKPIYVHETGPLTWAVYDSLDKDLDRNLEKQAGCPRIKAKSL